MVITSNFTQQPGSKATVGLSLPDFHPQNEAEKEETFDKIVGEFTEIMESEDNFFLIQQIQDRAQILESKKKHFNEIKSKFSKEISELEMKEQLLDNNVQSMSGQFDSIDFDQVTL